MAKTLEIKIDGLTEISKAMKELGKKTSNQISVKAMRAGGRIVRDAARAKAPVLQESVPHRRKGTIKRSIIERTKVGKNGKTTTLVGVKKLSKKRIEAFKTRTGKSGAKNPNDPYYWHMVEFGTSKMPAKPFLKPAFEQKKYQAKSEVIGILKKEILKAGK